MLVGLWLMQLLHATSTRDVPQPGYGVTGRTHWLNHHLHKSCCEAAVPLTLIELATTSAIVQRLCTPFPQTLALVSPRGSLLLLQVKTLTHLTTAGVAALLRPALNPKPELWPPRSGAVALVQCLQGCCTSRRHSPGPGPCDQGSIQRPCYIHEGFHTLQDPGSKTRNT